MRETWMLWRRPVMAVAVLLIVGGIGALYLKRERRHVVIKPNMILLAPDNTGGSFFRDSAYMVRVGGHEGADPMRVKVWYAGEGVLLSEREVQGAIEGMVLARREAELERVSGGVLAVGDAPGVEIELGIWGNGGFSSSVTRRCVQVSPASGRRTVAEFSMMGNRGLVSRGRDLQWMLTQIVDEAVKGRCAQAPGANAGVAASREPSLPNDVRVPQGRDAATGPVEVAAPPVAVRDSVALTKARAVNEGVARLLLATDTIRLQVGEVVIPEQALRLRAELANGMAVSRVVPLYVIDDHRLATMGTGGMRGVAPGETKVVVRAISGNIATAAAEGASATFVVKVTP